MQKKTKYALIVLVFMTCGLLLPLLFQGPKRRTDP